MLIHTKYLLSLFICLITNGTTDNSSSHHTYDGTYVRASWTIAQTSYGRAEKAPSPLPV